MNKKEQSVINIEAACQCYQDMFFKLPGGYDFTIEIPLEEANLIKQHFLSDNPMKLYSPFAAGEHFYYKGIRFCASK